MPNSHSEYCGISNKPSFGIWINDLIFREVGTHNFFSFFGSKSSPGPRVKWVLQEVGFKKEREVHWAVSCGIATLQVQHQPHSQRLTAANETEKQPRME